MDYFTYKNGALYAEDVALSEIATAAGTPFYCYSTATLTRHFEVFRKVLAEVNPLICYAVKACDTLAVLKTLAELGSGADVVSGGEIHRARAAGIPPERIIFSGVGKTRDEMAFALEKGIFQFNVESRAELGALAQIAGSVKKKAAIALRVNPDVIPETHAKISTGQKESKFGIPMEEAKEMYAYAATLPSIKVQGVSVHIGSQLSSLAPFKAAFARVATLVRELRAAGYSITTVDLGGGLGIPYGDKEAPPTPADYGAAVVEAMRGIDAQVIFEPGRLLVGNAGVMVTKVLYTKRSGARTFVVVDAGMNDLIRPAMYDAYHEIVPVVSSQGGAEPVDVVGPVCESSDVFTTGRTLVLPKAGDLLAFRTAGAYGASMASTYNTRTLLAEVIVKGGEYAIVRCRQTYEELLARDTLPPWL